MWVAGSDLPRSTGHPFYEQLNRVLDAAGLDRFVEAQCAKFYADGVGRPSLPPGRYFRMLLLGYFEGLESEPAIAWRAADSLSLRQFFDVSLEEAPPDHSTVSRTRRRIDVETHLAVFTWVLQRLSDAGLVKGRTVGIDATTLEANAALRSIVRRDTDEGYETFLRGLAAASGIATPTRAELARLDRKRPKKGSNDDWTHPKDPDAKTTKMKDGRTRLAHKAEHAVDLETGAVVGVSVQEADAGDTQTMLDTLVVAAEQLDAVQPAGDGLAEVVCDKGCHGNQTLVALAAVERRVRCGRSAGQSGRCQPRSSRKSHHNFPLGRPNITQILRCYLLLPDDQSRSPRMMPGGHHALRRRRRRRRHSSIARCCPDTHARTR
ncbi:MAG: transposase [Rhodospirillaceae bacterium]|nr:transposase [Rhodospirillaceae bacterium]